MPVSRRGQMISFSIEKDPDMRFAKWKRIPVKANQTIAKIAAKYGNPEDAVTIKNKNRVRGGVNYVLLKKLPRHATKAQRKAFKKRRQYRTILVPGNFSDNVVFHVLAGDAPPSITSGYAKFNQVTRPERASLLAFDGYDAIEMKVPIRFESNSVGPGGTKEAKHEGDQNIENDCALLERMAGRGQFEGAAFGPPAIITVSTTGSDNKQNALIPAAYQVSPQNPKGHRWRVVGIDWDDGSALRNQYGNRIRQLATVTLWEHVDLRLKTRSAVKRARTRPKPAHKKKTAKKGKR
jgi:hypothetical protein